MSLAICAIFRNEAPYLREWVECHRLAGVERFHLYQNRSDDDWQSVLQPFVDEGVVELTDWPLLPPCQLQAYQHFIGKHAGEPRWVAFLDCDEFLFSPSHASITDALEALSSPHWGAVGVNWMCFGASGQEQPEPGLVIERFTQRPADNFGPNRHIKSIVRMDRVDCAGPNSHIFGVRGGTFSESGVALAGPLSRIPAHSRLRINHYHTKSREEYLHRIARGKADGAAPRSPSEFDGYQAAEIDDRSIWRFLPALKQHLKCEPPAPSVPARLARSPYASYLPPELVIPRTTPREFGAYRNFHKGETMLVCGCGSSLPGVISPDLFPTIGVNDVGRLLHPDYLVVINPRSQFSGDRFQYVEASRAQAIFTQLDLGITHPNVIRFHLGRRGGTEPGDADSLPFTRNSPYLALCLALHMGARRVGVIGVDFTEHHFFAATGRHPLAGELNQINNEYAALMQACRQRGVEVFNLSAESRVTALQKLSPEQFVRSSLVPADAAKTVSGSKVFFVNYRFLSCGEVFSDGLRNAAQDLGMQADSAQWDDPALPAKVEEFVPDMLFVVHGRKYTQRWNSSVNNGRCSAVWLLDEPYEVDDTSRFSRIFDTTFLNDPSSLDRHHKAHFLPVCYDPATYHHRPASREHRVGFVGGGNPAREQMLQELARRELLSYVVGGPWHTQELRRLSRSLNIPATETAKLYQQTQIVVNVFRTAHHFNREQIPAVSMNPRIYEALACGSLVISERRPEIQLLCPEMPVFEGPKEMASIVEGLLADPARAASVRRACIRRLAGHTYAQRLYTAFTISSENRTAPSWIASSAVTTAAEVPIQPPARLKPVIPRIPPIVPGWEADPECVNADGDVLVLRACRAPAVASEGGLIGADKYSGVRMSFEVEADPGATFVAKIHQVEQRNQASNSYHLMVSGKTAYVARHNHVLQSFSIEINRRNHINVAWSKGTLTVEVNGKNECHVEDGLLSSGYCFLGIKSGSVRISRLELAVPTPDEPSIEPVKAPPHREQAYDLLYDSGSESGSLLEPTVSIVTTVYDRLACLEACLQSVQALTFRSYEHIIVADAPPSAVITRLRALVERDHDGRHRLRLASLRSRANDWGIKPAAAGLSLATGKYLCFLSDDNGYKPQHFEKLVAALEREPCLGFVYSGCLYDGRLTLNSARPSFGRIDLGQPLFRRELFDRHLNGTLPFRELAWDWKLIQCFMQNQVRWKHIADSTFIFHLAKYPHLLPVSAQKQLTGQPGLA